MRIFVIFLLWLLPLGVIAQGSLPSAAEILAEAYRRARETAFTSSYVASLISKYDGEEVFSLGGSIIFWSEYPWLRIETVGLEDVFLPVEIVDLKEKVIYSYVPERGWAKHVVSGGWLSLVDLDLDPLFRRVKFSTVEEGTLEGNAVWVLKGYIPPDTFGLMRQFETTLWIDRVSYVGRKTEIYFEFYFPGLDFTTTNELVMELTSYEEVDDVPDERFAVPDEVPEAPDTAGRIFPYPAPELRAVATSGEEISLADFREQVVVVFFWDMEAEIADFGVNLALMEGLRSRGEGKGLVVIGVVEGDPEIVGAFLEGFEAGMPTITDRASWAEALGVEEATFCVLVDSEGNVYAKTDPFSVLPLVLELVEE
jgi:peroxiredoxin